MEAPAYRPANGARRAPGSAGRARVALAAGAVLTAAACGFAAPVQDPPADPVPYGEVVGLWENGEGGTIEFREDGTYTATGSTFGASGETEVPAGEFDGRWSLCESIYTTTGDGEEIRSPECVESEAGEWIALGDAGALNASHLLFTGNEHLELYPYALETHTRDSDYYAKAD
ncbi:hypothetical protein LO763_18820 [Glycomyces sp. A-F 0318]|uniref:hypothetical protein n=1 Tax=Glycomyces amatae TaxID=2881355 RepID=UPI001E534E01|nr:hypothetical protein [Glycomyces amatae]MCD0445663.1 hypothetical protein [Glycomyces amatae]